MLLNSLEFSQDRKIAEDMSSVHETIKQSIVWNCVASVDAISKNATQLASKDCLLIHQKESIWSSLMKKFGVTSIQMFPMEEDWDASTAFTMRIFSGILQGKAVLKFNGPKSVIREVWWA